jgi:hypothetical protein
MNRMPFPPLPWAYLQITDNGIYGDRRFNQQSSFRNPR